VVKILNLLVHNYLIVYLFIKIKLILHLCLFRATRILNAKLNIKKYNNIIITLTKKKLRHTNIYDISIDIEDYHHFIILFS
jgi:hypothetical protein